MTENNNGRLVALTCQSFQLYKSDNSAHYYQRNNCLINLIAVQVVFLLSETFEKILRHLNLV